MKTKTERITLEITVLDYLTIPHEWDWPALLDLADKEEIKIVSYEIVEGE